MNCDKTRKIATMASILFYGMDGKHRTFGRMCYELNEEIDFTKMETAYRKAIRRFPYFNSKLKEENGGLVLVRSQSLPELHRDPLDYVINEQENDGYLYRVSVNGKYLVLQLFHGLTDGSGMNQLARLMLALYYAELGETVSLPEAAITLETPVSDDEYSDPLQLELFRNCPRKPREKASFFRLPKARGNQFHYFAFSCDGAALMKLSKDSDGSPNALMMEALARAIAQEHPKAQQQKIRIALTVDGKRIIGLKNNQTPLLQVSNFDFDEKTLNMDPEFLHTCIRGRIIRDTLSDDFVYKLAASRTLEELWELMPQKEGKVLLANLSLSMPASTATVSYAGPCGMGSIEKHIRSVITLCDSAVPLVEINFVNGRFYVALSGLPEGRAYMEAMAELLQQQGVPVTAVSEIILREGTGKARKLPGLGLNSATFQMLGARKKLRKKLTQ